MLNFSSSLLDVTVPHYLIGTYICVGVQNQLSGLMRVSMMPIELLKQHYTLLPTKQKLVYNTAKWRKK